MSISSAAHFGNSIPSSPAEPGEAHRVQVERDVKAALFRSFFALLEQREIPYAILSNYFAYPEVIHSDVDVVVPEAYRASIPQLVLATCQAGNAHLLQISEYHNTTACSCFVGAIAGDQAVHIRFDICSDDHRYSKLILPWQFLLEGRRVYPAGFYVPAPEKSLLHYLLKRIEKRSIQAPQLRTLARWLESATPEAEALLRAYFPRHSAQILDCLRQQTVPQAEWLREWSKHVQLRDARQGPWRRLRQIGKELRRNVRRIRMPMGYVLSFLGPDGCGKTTAIAGVKQALTPAFAHSAEYHLLPRAIHRGRRGEDASRPHAKVARGWLASALKMAVWYADLVIGYWLLVRPRMIRSTLVIFDRYIHDLRVDRVRYRYGGPGWWAALLSNAAPQPDLWVLLDAPSEVLWKRKPELTMEETARQRAEYRKLLAAKKNVVMVDATQPPERVVRDIVAAVFQRLQERTIRRHRLSPPTAS